MAANPIRCRRPGCGRPLRSARSAERGYSDRCWRMARDAGLAEALAIFTPAQIAAARKLIADRKVTRTSRPSVWAVESSDQSTVYVTTAATCTCPAGQHEVRCKHRAAVIIESHQAGPRPGWKAA